ncbi:MAG: hypothetical protein Q27BPR15_02300 [Rhodobacter sp. CACIA14H1]|nr:MAG: hypothetical protein Q27BPR15_02300 [Rhodobacter sp. CACIA14H1]
MYGNCLSCRSLVCIKGAPAKLENVKAELVRTERLLAKATAAPIQTETHDAWIASYIAKIQRLTNLISLLECDQIEDGTPIALAQVAGLSLPQYDPVQFGKRSVEITIAQHEREIGQTIL